MASIFFLPQCFNTHLMSNLKQMQSFKQFFYAFYISLLMYSTSSRLKSLVTRVFTQQLCQNYKDVNHAKAAHYWLFVREIHRSLNSLHAVLVLRKSIPYHVVILLWWNCATKDFKSDLLDLNRMRAISVYPLFGYDIQWPHLLTWINLTPSMGK